MSSSRTCLCLGLLLVLISASAQAQPQVQHPAAPPGATAEIDEFFADATSDEIPDREGSEIRTLTRQLTVDGLPPYLWDVDALVAIDHDVPDDLDIVLISPKGTRIVLVQDEGGPNANAFEKIWFDDQATTPVSDVDFSASVPSRVVPESALGGLIGENPNGQWTLEVSDDSTEDVGHLHSFGLSLSALDRAPILSEDGEFSVAFLVPVEIPDENAIASQVEVSGMLPFICSVELSAGVSAEFPRDLDMVLISPSNTRVVISTDNGERVEGFNGQFSGTVWTDASSSFVGDGSVYFPLVQSVVTPLVPEAAMSAFIGEDPNGTWVLRIADDSSENASALSGLSLTVRTCSDSGQLPGDCNSDGELDISDATCALLFLFTRTEIRLPCGDGSSTHEGNVRLLDWDSSGSLNLTDPIGFLSHLFSGGPPHPLGIECRALHIECESICGA